MQNTLLEQMGLGTLDAGYLVIAVLVLTVLLLAFMILSIVQICKVSKLKKRLDAFLMGEDGASLEQNIVQLFEDNQYLKNITDKNKKDIRVLYKKAENSFQKMGLIKYDAFHQMGGQLSFCLALLNEKNDGFIINSVHSTEGCYSYTKEIRNGACSIALGKEETEALAIAMGQ